MHLQILFLNYRPPTEIYTLSLHDALPISEARKAMTAATSAGVPEASRTGMSLAKAAGLAPSGIWNLERMGVSTRDRKSTRLNSSHLVISYAVFCLKKKIEM